MYYGFFQLERMPFENTLDPHFFFHSEDHSEALAALRYGVCQRRGVTMVTARPGCGKTFLGRMLIESLNVRCEAVTVSHRPADGLDLFSCVARRLGVLVPPGQSVGELVERLYWTLAVHRRRDWPVVVIVDDAHRLSSDVLDHLCMLAAMDLDNGGAFQIALFAEPELGRLLSDATLEELRQRIYCVRHVNAFDADASARYVRHRVERAGGDTELFTERAIELIHNESGGVPRLINHVADNALLFAFGARAQRVDEQLVHDAVRETMNLVPSSVKDSARVAAGRRDIVSAASSRLIRPTQRVLRSPSDEDGYPLPRQGAAEQDASAASTPPVAAEPQPVDVGSAGGELSGIARSFEAISERQSRLSVSLNSAVSKLTCGGGDIRRRIEAVRAG